MGKKLALSAVAVVLLGAPVYMAAPFYAAHQIREAMRDGDTATLAARVAFPEVRASLKSSMAELYAAPPASASAPERAARSIWSRVKALVVPGVADAFIDSYVTPEGLPKVFEMRKAWGPSPEAASATPAAATPLTRLTKFQRFWSRIERAEFTAPHLVELEVRDPKSSSRRYHSRLELRNWTWTLISVRVTGQRFDTFETSDRKTARLVTSGGAQTAFD